MKVLYTKLVIKKVCLLTWEICESSFLFNGFNPYNKAKYLMRLDARSIVNFYFNILRGNDDQILIALILLFGEANLNESIWRD